MIAIGIGFLVGAIVWQLYDNWQLKKERRRLEKITTDFAKKIMKF